MSPLAPVETTLPTSKQPLSPDEVRKIDSLLACRELSFCWPNLSLEESAAS